MKKIRAAVVGTGGFARHKIREMLSARSTTRLVGFIEPDARSREVTASMVGAEFEEPCPPFYDDLDGLRKGAGRVDVCYIITPHKFHYPWIVECLRAGIDVLVEKPMVLSASEARKVLALRDKTGRTVVVGFPGSLSPAMAKAKSLIAEGALGKVQGYSCFCHQRWMEMTVGTWRQSPEISGGGFLFDTGSHMINTMVDLAGEDVVEVSAAMDNCGSPVEINSVVRGAFRSGVQFSLLAAGNSFDCRGEVRVVGTDAILEIGIWGQYLRLLSCSSKGEWKDVRFGRRKNTWQCFVDVYRGRARNPCPAEVGLRFAELMDMIRRSASTGRRVRPGKR